MAFKQVRLGDYFKFEKGLGYKGEFLVEESSVGLVGIDSQVPGGGYKENSEKPYSGPYKPEHVVDSGDVIVAATDITQDGSVLGSTLMIPESTNYETLIYSGDVMKAIPLKPDEFSLEYFYNLYRVEKYRKKVAYGDTGTTVRRLSEDGICEQLVPLPNLPTQQAINEIILLLDQQIANNRLLSKNLEGLIRSIFLSSVTSKINLDNFSEIDFSTSSTLLGKIPKGWKIDSLGKCLSSLESGKRPKGGGSGDSNGIPSIGAESITGLGEFNYGKTKYVPKEYFDRMRSGIVKNLDILLYKDGAGAGNYITLFGDRFPYEKCCINEHVFIIRASNVSQIYLYFWMEQRKIRDLMIELAQKSAQPGLNKSNVSNIPIVIPDKSTLSDFEQLSKPLISMILQKSLDSKFLADTRDAILPRLIAGELTIPLELIAS
jgi:type I restriction enzyme S subunit